MIRSLAVLSTLAVLASGGVSTTLRAAAPGAPADAPPRDTIPILGPTIVAYFAATQAEADADGNVMEALADFQHYLPAVEKGLSACGVATIQTYDSPVFFLRERTVETFAPGELKIRVGYRLMKPGQPDLTLDGVHTDVDLLATAVEYFAVPADCWHPARDSG